MKKYSPEQIPVTYSDLVSFFGSCGVSRGETLIVHSSLKAAGWIVGGPEVVMRALLDTVGPEGTVMMPSQTWKNLDPSTGVHWEQPEEWWPLIRGNWPAYDPATTPSIGMGLLAETLRTWPGAVRSDHPARSFAAVGQHAKHLTENHDLKNIFGEGSPLAKFYDLDGRILLFGVGHDKNTSLHLAEMRASFPKTMSTEHSAIMTGGKRVWTSYETPSVDDSDFIELGAAFEKEHSIPAHRLGSADVRLIRQRDLVDFAVRWMNAHRSRRETPAQAAATN